MSYLIDARLESGTPSLTLTDANTGKECLHWRGNSSASPENAWQSMFRRLMLLSCVDRLSLIQRTKTPSFGGECVECRGCEDQVEKMPKIYKAIKTPAGTNVIPFQKRP